jgi:hypothetical protein
VAQPGGTSASGVACNPIGGLPIYPDAACMEQDTDTDDGVIKLENTYTTNASVNDVGRFYESAFAEQGWTLQAFQYEASLGQRSVGVEVEAQQGPNGRLTTIKLTEKGAPAAGTTCSAIEGLPVYPNATCVAFDSDRDDGVIKNENTYSVAVSPEDVRGFYANAFAQNGWTGLEAQYEVTQGQRRVAVELDTQSAPTGTLTRFKIAEK